MAEQDASRRSTAQRPLPDLPDLSRTPMPSSPLLDRGRPAFQRLLRTVWRIDELHTDRIPQGAAIIACNHVGYFDGPLAVAMSPDSLALAKVELWGSRPLGRVLDAFGQIPVDRVHSDAGAMRRCIKLLSEGRKLVIFPESHRGKGDFEHFKPGAAYLAMVTGAPVVPLALVGTAIGGIGVRSIPRPRMPVKLVYGEPIGVEPKPWPRTTAEVGDLGERLRRVCAQHVQQAQQETGLELL